MAEAAKYRGCVIGESLEDPTLINQLDVWRAWITQDAILSADDGAMSRWHIYWIECGAEDIARIQQQLKPWRWYAHFWRGDRLVVVFRDARFEMSRDPSTWTAAVEHGRRKGIPEDQLDFLII